MHASRGAAAQSQPNESREWTGYAPKDEFWVREEIGDALQQRPRLEDKRRQGNLAQIHTGPYWLSASTPVASWPPPLQSPATAGQRGPPRSSRNPNPTLRDDRHQNVAFFFIQIRRVIGALARRSILRLHHRRIALGSQLGLALEVPAHPT